MKHTISIALLCLFTVTSAWAQVGIFDNDTDIGEPEIPSVPAEFADGTYTMDAIGSGIGRQTFTDQFKFVYTEMSGSFFIECDSFPIDDVGLGGIMIRQNLDPDSPHASYMRSGSSPAGSNTNADLGSLFPRVRSVKGGGTITDGDIEGGFTDDNAGVFRLERIGNSIHFYSTDLDGNLVFQQTEVVPMDQTVLVGLAATAQAADGLGLFEFTDVQMGELPLYVERDLPADEFTPGASLTGVSVVATARDGETLDAVINESINGGRISNAQVTGGELVTNADGSLTWTLTGFSGEATLTYDATLGNSYSAVWQGTFEDGVNAESYIGGETLLPKTPGFISTEDPIVIDTVIPTVFHVIQGTIQEGSEDFFGLGVDPRTQTGITVFNMRGNQNNIIEIPIQVQEAGTYWLFGSVRGDDGNSDSWHFSIDEPPAGDNSSRWNIGGGGSFNAEWVEQEDPDNDPRPFDLSAGEHTILLGNREDGAQIEWLAMTNDPNINIAGFDINTEILLSRSIENPVIDPAGHEITVSLSSRTDASNDLRVVEVPPAGWDVSGISASAGDAAMEGGELVWNMSGVGGAQTLTYTVTPPADVLGGVFDGSTVHRGETIEIGGDDVISGIFEFENINVANPTPFPMSNGSVFIEAEDAYVVSEPADGPVPFEILFRPDASQQLYAVSTIGDGGVIGNELDFVFEVQEAGTYRAVAKMYTPSGEDDSFYVGMDDAFALENGPHRFQGTGHEGFWNDDFHILWVRSDDIETLTWDLNPGVHTLRFHVRENGTGVDWVYITNDIEMDLTEFDPPETGILDFMLY